MGGARDKRPSAQLGHSTDVQHTQNIVANILISRADNQGTDNENCTQDAAAECGDLHVALPMNMRNKKGVTAVKCHLCIAVFTLDAGLLARSQYSEGPATGHLDTGFSWFHFA